MHRRVLVKKESTGAEARDCFAVLNAWLKSGDHKNSFLVLRMGCNGTNSPATVAVHADSWLAKEGTKVSAVCRCGGVRYRCGNGLVNVIPLC